MKLDQRGPMNQSTLAGLLGFAPRSVTDTVDALERDGLVTRTEDEHDRRQRFEPRQQARVDELPIVGERIGLGLSRLDQILENHRAVKPFV